jgi:hypothetical protein
MPYKVARQDGRYYVVKAGGKAKGKRATTGPGQKGGPVKKGGHSSRAKALARAQAINLSLRRAAGKSAPPRRK